MTEETAIHAAYAIEVDYIGPGETIPGSPADDPTTDDGALLIDDGGQRLIIEGTRSQVQYLLGRALLAVHRTNTEQEGAA